MWTELLSSVIKLYAKKVLLPPNPSDPLHCYTPPVSLRLPPPPPDPMHTCLGLAGLSLNKEAGLSPLYPALTITQRAAAWMHQLHQKWREQ